MYSFYKQYDKKKNTLSIIRIAEYHLSLDLVDNEPLPWSDQYIKMYAQIKLQSHLKAQLNLSLRS